MTAQSNHSAPLISATQPVSAHPHPALAACLYPPHPVSARRCCRNVVSSSHPLQHPFTPSPLHPHHPVIARRLSISATLSIRYAHPCLRLLQLPSFAPRRPYPGVNHHPASTRCRIVPVHHTPRALIPTPCFLSCDHPSRTPTTPPLRSPPSPSSSPAAVTWSVHPTTHQLPAAGGAPPDALAPCPHHQPVPTASRLRSPPIPFSYPAGKPKKCTRSSPTTQQQQGSPRLSRLNPPHPAALLQTTSPHLLACDHPPLTIPNNHRPRSPYPAGKQTPPAPSSSPLHPPLLPYPRVDHHPAAGECHRLARPRRPTAAPPLSPRSLSYPGVRENPASAPTPCNRPATLLPPWCSPNLVSRLNPPTPSYSPPRERSPVLPSPLPRQ